MRRQKPGAGSLARGNFSGQQGLRSQREASGRVGPGGLERATAGVVHQPTPDRSERKAASAGPSSTRKARASSWETLPEADRKRPAQSDDLPQRSSVKGRTPGAGSLARRNFSGQQGLRSQREASGRVGPGGLERATTGVVHQPTPDRSERKAASADPPSTPRARASSWATLPEADRKRPAPSDDPPRRSSTQVRHPARSTSYPRTPCRPPPGLPGASPSPC